MGSGPGGGGTSTLPPDASLGMTANDLAEHWSGDARCCSLPAALERIGTMDAFVFIFSSPQNF
ncbi:hypothetical protein AGR1B_pAt30027 [Agrobacterium fabacearum S56]|nr:hypothetical protein AGR1B_pAt30027 [Agrobacterium fabacearum S56]